MNAGRPRLFIYYRRSVSPASRGRFHAGAGARSRRTASRNSCIRYPLPFLIPLVHPSCCRTGKFQTRDRPRKLDFGSRRISPNACIFVCLPQLAALIARSTIAAFAPANALARSLFSPVDDRSTDSRIFGYSKCRRARRAIEVLEVPSLDSKAARDGRYSGRERCPSRSGREVLRVLRSSTSAHQDCAECREYRGRIFWNIASAAK